MFKRAISITFLLLANIILLAHVIIPHHHHTMQVCLVSSHCTEDGDHSNTREGHKDHQHDDQGDTQCVLNQIVLIPANTLKKDNTLFIANSDDFKADHAQLCLLYFTFKLPEKSSFPSLKNQDEVPSLFGALISHSLGLRAPPAV
jgi:hypothetical protein